jgi:cell division protein FtsL
MTLIQPNKENILLNWLLIALIFAATAGVIWLIFLYNQTVSFTHGASALRDEAKRVETHNSELKGTIFALFEPGRVKGIAESGGLVADKNPEYARITNEWLAASHL